MLENLAQNASITSKQEKSWALDDTSPSQRPQLEGAGLHQLSSPACIHHSFSAEKPGNLRLNLINSKIEQLENENWRLRQHLITQI